MADETIKLRGRTWHVSGGNMIPPRRLELEEVPSEPDEVEASLGQRLYEAAFPLHFQCGDGPLPSFSEAFEGAEKYVRANYMSKDAAKADKEAAYWDGHEEGGQAAQQKSGISEADLETLAQGLATTDEDFKLVYLNRVLKMLNAEVVPDVDFIVSGVDGENLIALTNKARADWPLSLGNWKTLSCEQRRGKVARMYGHGNRILLDKEGGTNG